MNTKSIATLAAAAGVLIISSLRVAAQTPAPAMAPATAALAAGQPDVKAQLQALVTKVKDKLQSGQTTEADLAPELKEFDSILAAHTGQKTDDLAQVAVMKAQLYMEIFQEPVQGLAMLKQVVRDYPNTIVGQQIAAALPQLETGMAAAAGSQAIRAKLAIGAAFPDFAVQDLTSQPLSVAKFKGKIVLVDFWATWCGPCMEEMPNVIAAYNKYHDKGFEIIGVSLDRDDPGEKDKLAAFLKDHQMPWPQYYDGKYWQNDLAVKYGVDSIPASYLLDGSGNILAVSPRGAALAPAIEKALASLTPAAAK
jgi:thiol-disulfide isomerase/thioredoxin